MAGLSVLTLLGQDDLGHTGIRRGKDAILTFGMLKIPCAAEIIFCACAANRREIDIAIHVKFDFAFAPPARIIDTPCNIRADILPLSAHIF